MMLQVFLDKQRLQLDVCDEDGDEDVYEQYLSCRTGLWKGKA
jgi:hypothetical protein